MVSLGKENSGSNIVRKSGGWATARNGIEHVLRQDCIEGTILSREANASHCISSQHMSEKIDVFFLDYLISSHHSSRSPPASDFPT